MVLLTKQVLQILQKLCIILPLGLPAFAIIKVFSTFLFARNDTKTPFYYSLISVLINISISLLFFDEFGFIIIPIATSISSWINALLLFLKLYTNNYFKIIDIFCISNFKIVMVSILSIYFLYFNKFIQRLSYL